MDNQKPLDRSAYAHELMDDIAHLELTITGLKKELLDFLVLPNEHSNEIDVINNCVSILKDMISTTKWRVLNVMLRWYDLPLQGANIYHRMERVIPETSSFVRSTFHKKF